MAFGFDAELLGEFALGLGVVGQELVEGWIEETDGGRQAFEGGENAGEVFTLVRQEFRQGFLTAFEGCGEDHLAHGVDAVAFEEHVLGAGQADAGGTEGEGDAGLLRGIGVGADGQFGGPFHTSS